MDSEVEKIQEEEVRAQLRRQARQVLLQAALVAVALTLLGWLVPL